MSYSQMFQRPVQAATPPMVAVFAAGHFIEKMIFLPSYETSGSDASPWPIVNGAVMLCSGALGEDFSRMKRSPPGALGAPLVGFMLIELARMTYATATSPCTVTVVESVPLPLPQATRPVVSAAAINASAPNPPRCFIFSPVEFP